MFTLAIKKYSIEKNNNNAVEGYNKKGDGHQNWGHFMSRLLCNWVNSVITGLEPSAT